MTAADFSGDRRNVHNTAAAFLFHVIEHHLAAHIKSREVNSYRSVPFFLAELRKACCAYYTCYIYKDIDFTCFFNDLRIAAANRFRFGHIHNHRLYSPFAKLFI